MKECKHHRILRCVDCDYESLKSKVEEMQETIDVSKETLRELYFQVGQDMDINPSAKTVYLSKIAFANNALKGNQ